MTIRRSNRREFLQGRAARDAIENLADGIHDARSAQLPSSVRPTEVAVAKSYLLEFARDAMAVEFQVLLNPDDSSEAAVAALDLLEPLEAQLSVYREQSEVSRINRDAFVGPCHVERRLFRLLQQAQSISFQTGGAYDATSGPLSKLWGFYRRQGRLPADAEIAATLEHVGSRHLQFDNASNAIQFLTDGMELNLGGIGKGYALDRMSEHMLGEGVGDFLLHGGQSSVLARGTRAGASAEQPGWTVGLAHPLRPGERLAEFRLHNQALGTSGSGTQFFHHQGKRYGHILDPRSGRPAEGTLSSTVIAPTAAEADALSTAFYVGGLELADAYCREHANIAAVLVQQMKSDLVVSTFNLSENKWQRAAGTL